MLASDGPAIWQIASLAEINHQEVISTARCTNPIGQFHRPTRRRECQQQEFKRRKRAQGLLCLHARIENIHHHSRTSVPAQTRRSNQKQAFQTWSMVTARVA